MPPKKDAAKPSPLEGDGETSWCNEEEKDIMERELLIAHLKQKLGRYQGLCEGLRADNIKLSDELRMQGKNFEEIHSNMAAEKEKLLQEKKEESDRLASTQEEMGAMREDFLRQIEEEGRRHNAEIGEMQDRLDDVTRRFMAVEQFMGEKERLETELNARGELLASLQKKHEEELRDLERSKMQEKDRLKKEMALKIKETKAQMMKLTDNQLETTTKRTIMENEQMSSELAYQSRQTEKLLQKNQSLLAENAAMKRGMELSKQTQAELAKRNHVYQKTIKTLLAKLKAQDAATREMEGEVRKLRESDAINLERLEDAAGNAEDAGREAGDLGREVERLQGELARAEDQHDETARFLLACLEDVKRQIVTVVKEGPLRQHGEGPPDSVVVLPGRLDELSLEQRERALGYLLEKLHAFQSSKQSRLLGLRGAGGAGVGAGMGMGLVPSSGEPSAVSLPPIGIGSGGGRPLDALYGGESGGGMAAGAFRYPQGGGGGGGERSVVSTGVQTSGTELLGLGDISSMVFSEVRPWGKRAEALPLTQKGVDTYMRKGGQGWSRGAR